MEWGQLGKEKPWLFQPAYTYQQQNLSKSWTRPELIQSYTGEIYKDVKSVIKKNLI